jgi:hypothetical protein
MHLDETHCFPCSLATPTSDSAIRASRAPLVFTRNPRSKVMDICPIQRSWATCSVTANSPSVVRCHISRRPPDESVQLTTFGKANLPLTSLPFSSDTIVDTFLGADCLFPLTLLSMTRPSTWTVARHADCGPISKVLSTLTTMVNIC